MLILIANTLFEATRTATLPPNTASRGGFAPASPGRKPAAANRDDTGLPPSGDAAKRAVSRNEAGVSFWHIVNPRRQRFRRMIRATLARLVND